MKKCRLFIDGKEVKSFREFEVIDTLRAVLLQVKFDKKRFDLPNVCDREHEYEFKFETKTFGLKARILLEAVEPEQDGCVYDGKRFNSIFLVITDCYGWRENNENQSKEICSVSRTAPAI